MKNFFKFLPAACLASALLFSSCQNDKGLVEPSASAVSSDVSVGTNNAYNVNLLPASPYNASTNTTTFSYTVQKTGTAKGIGLSHLIFKLSNCIGGESATYTDVVDVTVTGGALTEPYRPMLADSEGSGTGCFATNSATVGSFIKLDNLASFMSNGSTYTVNIVLRSNWAVSSSTGGMVWVKFGNNCASAPIAGPGCKVVVPSCSMSQGFYFAKPMTNKGAVAWPSAVVKVGGDVNGMFVGTEATQLQGQNLWDNNRGNYPYHKAFFQASAIKLSMAAGQYKGGVSSVDNALQMIDNAFRTNGINLLAPSTIPSGNTALENEMDNAAGTIGSWISNNHCDGPAPAL